jgi:DNA invertase Pin-like site-specific DNA recombinase
MAVRQGDCLIYTGSKSRDGYGVMGINYKTKRGNHKLTDEQIQSIPLLLKKQSMKELAKKFGVTKQCIWKHRNEVARD